MQNSMNGSYRRLVMILVIISLFSLVGIARPPAGLAQSGTEIQGTLAVGETVNGELTADSLEHFWELQVSAVDTISVQAEIPASVQDGIFFAILNAETATTGKALYGIDLNRPTEKLTTFTLTGSGPYRLFVYAFNPTPYTLTLLAGDQILRNDRGPIELGVPVTGTIVRDEFALDCFSITVPPEGEIAATIEGGDGLLGVLPPLEALGDPTWSIDENSLEVTFTLPAGDFPLCVGFYVMTEMPADVPYTVTIALPQGGTGASADGSDGNETTPLTDDSVPGVALPQAVAGTPPITWQIVVQNDATVAVPEGAVQGFIDVSIGPDDSVYLVDGLFFFGFFSSADYVRVYGADGGFLRSIALNYLTVDVGEIAHVVDAAGGFVPVTSLAGFTETATALNSSGCTAGQCFAELHAVYGPAGEIVVLAWTLRQDEDTGEASSDYRVLVLSPDGEALVDTWFADEVFQSFREFWALAAGPDGLYLLVTNYDTRQAAIQVLNPSDGSVIRTIDVSADAPIIRTLAVSADGLIYLLEGPTNQTRSLKQLDAAGNVLNEVAIPIPPSLGNLSLEKLAVLSDGGVIVVATTNTFDVSVVTRVDFGGNAPAVATQAPSDTTAPETAPTTAAINCTVAAPNTVNQRSGPGTDFAAQGQLNPGETEAVDGQARGNDGITWWRLTDGSWVRSDVVDETGDCDAVPVVTP